LAVPQPSSDTFAKTILVPLSHALIARGDLPPPNRAPSSFHAGDVILRFEGATRAII
jgi:hypothetical protein